MRGMNRLRTVGFGALGLLVLIVLWDLYAAVGPTAGVRLGGTLVLPRSDEFFPQSWEIVQRLGDPVRSGSDETVFAAVLSASFFTLSLALQGWVIGVAIGLVLATLMTRFRVAEQGLLPWVVLSQTVPLIAIAPLVNRMGSQFNTDAFEWTKELSVLVIAAYLAFFSVAVGALRGFKAPQTTHLELMQAYGAGWWRTFFTLRVPASVPFLLPALRLAAASAVIGAVVAEVSMTLEGGIGRMVVTYAQSGTSDPTKAYAPILGAVLVGLVAAGLVGLIGLVLKHFKLTGAQA